MHQQQVMLLINSYADIQSKSIKLGDGTNTTTLNAASSGGALSLTLPSGNGTNGQYLETDGSGNLSWSTVSSGINDYITEGNTRLKQLIMEAMVILNLKLKVLKE